MTTSWDDLAVAALLGTDRRRVDLATLPGAAGEAAARLDASDAAAALLDGAAILSAYQRAGRRAQPGAADPPPPAPPETAPVVPAGAAARLDRLLATGDTALLTEWLALVRAAGLVVPPAALPALLDLLVTQPQLAALASPVLGQRGQWLAAVRPQWRGVTSPQLSDDRLVDDEPWRLGDRTTRHAWFAAVRRTDPTRARDLLAASWGRETGPDREALLALLGTGLSSADEPLLEHALDDRRAGVRQRAGELLVRLPTSALADRMRQRAAASVAVERRMGRTQLVVRPPDSLDAAMLRDGVVPPSGKRGEQGRSLLAQIVARTPLGHWTAQLGTDPEGVLHTPVDEGWRDALLTGWAAAACRQRDAAWALGLLPHAPPRYERDLVAVLDPQDRARVVADLLLARRGADGQNAVNRMLGDLPAPWPHPVAAVTITWLASPQDLAHAHVRLRLSLAGRRLPVELAEQVATLVAALPDGSLWRAAVSQVAGTLADRRAMHEELR